MTSMIFQTLITPGILTSSFQTLVGVLIDIEWTATDVMQLAHVFLQVEVATETLVTNPTRIGLLVVVGVHVEGEIVDLMESLVAYVALVGLLAAVRKLVIFVVALLMESFATELTHKWFVASMDAGVGVQGGRSIEGLAACLTFVRLL